MLAMRRSAAACAPFPLSPAVPGIRPTETCDAELRLTMKSKRKATFAVGPDDAVSATLRCVGRLAVFCDQRSAA